MLSWLVLSEPELRDLLEEHGPLENATVMVYAAVVFALAMGLRASADWRSRLALMVFAAALCARELDLHKAVGGKSVLKVSYYLGNVPWPDKLMALLVVATVAVSAMYLLLRHARPVLRALRWRQPMAVTVVLLAVVVAASKVLDRSASVLPEDFGVVLPVSWVLLLLSLEEFLELAIPLLFLSGQAQQRAARH